MLKTVNLPSGVALEYVEHGGPSGLRIVCLHGLGDSWRSFEPVLPYLPSSMHTYVPSLRGHGDSDHPATGYRINDLSADLLAFMDALAIPVTVIVGHGMGASVAMRFAIDHPERTLGLVLVGASPTLRDSHDIRGLPVPAYVAWGSRDAFVSVGERQALLSAMPGARLLRYPGAGHQLHRENPARFAAHVIAFARGILLRAGRRADRERWRATA